MEPTTSYDVDSRLIFFRLEQLEHAVHEDAEMRAAQAAMQEAAAVTSAKDLQDAQDRIHALETQLSSTKTRYWTASAAAGLLSAMLLEGIRALLRR